MKLVNKEVKEMVEKMYEKIPENELETIKLYVNYKPEEEKKVKLETTSNNYTLLDTKELYEEGRKEKSAAWLEQEILKRVENFNSIEKEDILEGLVELKKVSNRLYERNKTIIESYRLQGEQVISKQDVSGTIKELLETGIKYHEVFPKLSKISTLYTLGKIKVTEDKIVTINNEAKGVMQISRAKYKGKIVWVMVVSIGENKETILLGEDVPEEDKEFVVEPYLNE